MPPSVPKLVLRPIAPDGLLPRQAFTLTSDAASLQCSIVSGKRTLGVCTNVTSVVPETLPASSVATAHTPHVISRLLDGFNQTVLVVGLAGSGTSTFLEGSLPKNAGGGYLDGLMKSLFEALKVKAASPQALPAVAAAGATNVPTAVTSTESQSNMTFSASICVHEHYSELVRDLLSSKRDKEIDTSGIQWDANALASLPTLTRRSVASHGDAMDAIGKAKLAKTNVKGRTEKTTVVYQLDLEQHIPSVGEGTAALVSTLHVVELFAIDRLTTDQAVHSQVNRDSEAVGKQMVAVDAGLAMLGKGPFESPGDENTRILQNHSTLNNLSSHTFYTRCLNTTRIFPSLSSSTLAPTAQQ
ncbi:hypothetical protein BCR44DRAFT_1282518 [Catenaria anguillulae PL171]|uniref:Kinesin motor domain-containing protein n=1 Tax=Catenaria anguillulae PL171 TaxID=765915 RepID=A0A1Y2HYL8_9FUNG|nr:hypothetical protein BCR44DRAFT_1282518 [Catenaria anguillulae PL171]